MGFGKSNERYNLPDGALWPDQMPRPNRLVAHSVGNDYAEGKPVLRSAASIQVPAVGRVVHFVKHGRCLAADVCDVDRPGELESELSLFVKDSELGECYFAHHVRHSYNRPLDEDTWHWPEYVAPK